MSTAQFSAEISHDDGPVFFATLPNLSNRTAVIYKPSRSVITSGSRRTKQWVLRFERCEPPYIEPLMGWTGGGDPMAQVEIRFDSLASAVRYADRHRLSYRMLHQHERTGNLLQQYVTEGENSDRVGNTVISSADA
jgi:hypothetical protein